MTEEAGRERFGEEAEWEETSQIDSKVIGAVVRFAAMRVKGVENVVENAGAPFIKNITGFMGGGGKDRGVGVTTGTKGAIVDLGLVVTYGHSIPEIMESVRKEVRTDIKSICGIEAKAVNIVVSDIKSTGSDPSRIAQVN